MEEEIILMEENDIEEITIEEENYSGKPYKLPIASADVLGGIKVGENLTIDEDGTLNASGGISEESDPTVPAHVKAITKAQIEKWNNGTGDVDLTEYAKKSEVPTRTSQLENDSKFINKIKTINGQSIEGEGNIVIEGGSGSETSNVVVSPTEPLTSEDVWFQKGVNLFNKETAEKIGYIQQDGSIYRRSNYYITDYIKVIPGEQYTYSGFLVSITNVGVINHAYYDKNKNLVSTFARTKDFSGTITIPEGVSYIKFSLYFFNDDVDNELHTFQFEKGTTASAYTEYVEDKIYTKTNNGYEEFKVYSEKELYCAKLSAQYDQTLVKAWDKHLINFNTEMARVGSNLTLNNGKIKIGKGISKVSLQATVLIAPFTVEGTVDLRLRLVRSGVVSNIGQTYVELKTIKNFQTMVNLFPLLDVIENDEIELVFTSDVAGDFRISHLGTFLSVEKKA